MALVAGVLLANYLPLAAEGEMRQSRFFSISLGFLLPLLLLAGCGILDPVRWERVVGMIMPDPGIPVVVAPESARAGVSFQVRVVTRGSSSCTRADGAEVHVNGLVAEITPYDRVQRGPVACTADLSPIPREVSLRFAAAGEAVVRVIGRGAGGREEVEVRLTVLPVP
jgi:hypothetical protein